MQRHPGTFSSDLPSNTDNAPEPDDTERDRRNLLEEHTSDTNQVSDSVMPNADVSTDNVPLLAGGSYDLDVTSRSNNTHLNIDNLSSLRAFLNIIIKAAPLTLIYGTELGSDFIQTYLLSRENINLIKASSIAYFTTNMVMVPMPFLISQDAVFIAEKFGKVKALKASSSSEPSNLFECKSNCEDIGVIVRQGWILSAGVGLISSALLLSLGGPLIKVFAQSDEVNNLASSYIRLYSIIVPTEFISKINERFLSAVDEEKWIIPYRLSTFGLQVSLGFLLIPRYGINGAACSLLAKSLAGCLGLIMFLGLKNNFKDYAILKMKLGSLSYSKNILAQGIPVFISQVLRVSSSFVISTFMARLPNNRIVVEQILTQSFGLAQIINTAISEATNRIVAQNFGASNFIATRKTGNVGLMTNFTSSVIFCTLLFVFSDQISKLFLANDGDNTANNDDLYPVIKYSLIIFSISYVSKYLYNTLYSNLAAVNDTLFTSIVVILATYLVALPLAAMSVSLTNFDIYGAAAPIALSSTICAALSFIYWFKHSKALVESNSIYIKTSNEACADMARNFVSRWNKSTLFSCTFINSNRQQIPLESITTSATSEDTVLIRP